VTDFSLSLRILFTLCGACDFFRASVYCYAIRREYFIKKLFAELDRTIVSSTLIFVHDQNYKFRWAGQLRVFTTSSVFIIFHFDGVDISDAALANTPSRLNL
jgi:hypothetical protein